MVHRPIFWGVLCLIIGIAGWFIFVMFSVVTLGHFSVQANFFAKIAYIGFPIFLIWELILKIKNKYGKK
jgi:hypothetical protein